MLKHNENLNKKEKVKYDLYKIPRMSVFLSQKEADEVTLDKFKEASLNIDKLLSDEYEEKLDTMFYSTATLEEEERRLKDLVAFINERIEKRKELTEDYKNVTKKDVTDLEYISRSGELDLYEKRLNTIKDYLDNSRLIEVNEQDLETLKEQLVKEFDLKQENELIMLKEFEKEKKQKDFIVTNNKRIKIKTTFKGKKLLLGDYNKEMLKHSRKIFLSLVFDVDIIESGDALIQKVLCCYNYDVIVTNNIYKNSCDGPDILREFKELPDFETLIVVLTVSTGQKEKFINEIGFDGYLEKMLTQKQAEVVMVQLLFDKKSN